MNIEVARMTEHGRRILLAEDDPLIRLLLVDCLEEAGFEVLAADSGDEAVQLLVDPDDVTLLVTDIQMPGSRDGNAVAAAARAKHPGIPVVYMTGNPSSLRVRLGDRDTLVRKPFAPSDVLTAVHRLLGDE
jgi:CheY-like chemotaxis protein